MNILGIESSATAAGAAVISGDKLLSECFVNCGLTHSQTLLPLIDKALCSAGITINEIDAIAVSAGPGSFTGLRIGVGTAKGLAMPCGKPVIPVPTLLALAQNVSCAQGIIAPIMDARRGEVYTALYKSEKGTLTEIMPMTAMPLTELLKKLPDGATFVGDGVEVHKNTIINTLSDKAQFAPLNLLHQRASSVAFAATQLQSISAEELVPIYIRKPQAEREFDEKENKK